MKNEKIIAPLAALAARLHDLRRQGRRIVLCHGVFDLLHIGHIRYFEQARQEGDVLVVTVTPDRFVDKGPQRPAFPEKLRAEAVASLACVDFVAINEWPTAMETLRLLQPHVYVKGAEFKDSAADPSGKIAQEEAVVREIGARIRFTGDIVFSSSTLINRYLSNLPRELDEYLDIFRQRHDMAEVLGVLEAMAGLKVLVVGDTIIDDYHYCEAIGKSSKDPTLVLKHQSTELFAGGVLAVANHAAGFAGQVDMLTVIGDTDSHEAFIRARLAPRVSPRFLVRPGTPTTLKRRFIDGYSFNKLLELYVMDDRPLPEELDNALCGELSRAAGYDLVIAADFGHGAISANAVRTLAAAAPYLAVNTQANAGNRGFHTIGRYPRMDYGCIARHELELESRDKNGPIRPHMERLTRQLGCSRFTVTLGRKGSAVTDKNGDFVVVPSFALRVVDRVGAGDAFFAVTAMAARLDAASEILAFIGNVVGSLAVEIIGNQKAIDLQGTRKYITALLK